MIMMPDQIHGQRGIAVSSDVGTPITTLLCLAVFAFGYLFSTWLLDAYRAGDQEHYTNFWQAMMWAHPSQWKRLQVEYLSSAEPLYRYIIGAATYFRFDRIAYLSCWNGLLLSAICYIFIKYKANLLFSLLMMTNYYLLVLLGPAERLKFAYIALVLAFCGGGVKWRGFMSILSVFAHTQAFVQFSSSALYYFAENRHEILSNRFRTIIFALATPVVLGLAGYLLFSSSGDIISSKAEVYGQESQGIFEIIQWLLILIGGMFVFDNKSKFLVGMLPMGVLTALYGNRINVATLAFFCAIALTRRKTSHPLVLAVMAYMSFKSIGFILNIMETGQGF